MADSLIDLLLADDTAVAVSSDWRPSDAEATLVMDVTLLDLPLTLRGRIRTGREGDTLRDETDVASLVLQRLCRARGAAEQIIIRAGVGPLLWERLSVPHQEAVYAKLGAADFEEILDPLASSLPAAQRASWHALRGTDLWWEHMGEPIYRAVDVQAEGALIEFLDLRW